MRLRDVPFTIGWGAVALFLRHLPYDSETMRELRPEAQWTVAEHRLADIVDMLGIFMLGDGYTCIDRPGAATRKRFEDAQPVSAGDMDAEIAEFMQGKRK